MIEEERGALSGFSGRADLAVVLGSGLASLEHLVEIDKVISYENVPGLVLPTVDGHPGRLSLCRVGDAFLLLFTGRLHIYEGLDFGTAGAVVDLASELGCRRVLLTHAAGGLHGGVSKMSWLLPSDIVSFPHRISAGMYLAGSLSETMQGSVGASCGSKPGDGREFIIHSYDSSSGNMQGCIPSSPGSLISDVFRGDIFRVAAEAGVSVRDGVLFWSTGPSYETFSEARAAFEIGADAVSMSCLPELMAARRLGLAAACMSWITNHTVNVIGEVTCHDDVLRSGGAGAGTLFKILCGLVSKRGREGRCCS